MAQRHNSGVGKRLGARKLGWLQGLPFTVLLCLAPTLICAEPQQFEIDRAKSFIVVVAHKGGW